VKRRLTLLAFAAIATVLLATSGRREIHGFTLVVRAADLHGVVRRLADLDTVPIRERLVETPLDAAPMRARIYAPLGTSRQTVLLVTGLHPAGIDEPRLVNLSRRLAEANVTVVTPEIPELSRFEVVPAVTDRIEDAALWLATRSGLAPTGRIGLMGVSFSGGLAIVAAGRASIRNRLLYVLSFGGHDDLARVLEYFCTGVERDGRSVAAAAPHDYGVALVLLNVAERLVPPEQLVPLRDAVRRFLWASYLDRFDKPQAAREFAALRDLARALPEPSATLLHYVNDRDVAHLGPRLRPYVGFYVDQPALSPARSPVPSAPVYLLHGRDDNVIPAGESEHLADRLRGLVPIHLLVTNLISHADADQPAHVSDVFQLAHFWGALLDQ
jgi:pimeloyl-ACP methyl ester carboxylesterase